MRLRTCRQVGRFDNDAAKTYKHFGISKDYKTPEEPTVIIEGNVWRYNYELPDEKGNKLDCRDIYEFVTPEKMITRIEISADGVGIFRGFQL
ncbi:MAG: hypothetical protein WBQ89_15705 [Candidatus Acidiferrum sp.]